MITHSQSEPLLGAACESYSVRVPASGNSHIFITLGVSQKFDDNHHIKL